MALVSSRTTQTLSLVLNKAGLARALKVPAYELKVVKGPDKRRQKRIEAVRAVIGAGEGADLQLTDPTVSAVHCELVQTPTGVVARDLGARNGLVVADRRVKEVWLKPTDELTLGDTVVRFSLGKDAVELPLSPESSFGRLAGSSAAMREVYRSLERAAKSDAPVLVHGETGTGKELAAEALWQGSSRRDRPFVVVDCARLPANLAESELFGHEKGAFSGAVSTVHGAFERAHTGTLLLDELGELPLDLQSKLLGVLGRGQLTRVGGGRPIDVDVRVIAATNRDLLREVNRGTFRSDLYYRLAVLQVRMPSLRERREDLPVLVQRFAEEDSPGQTVSAAALERLLASEYPGNVRELRAAVQREVLGFAHAPSPPAAVAAIDLDVPFKAQKEALISGFERQYLKRLLDACGGNVTAASARSGISRVYLHGVLRRYGISSEKD